MFKCSFCHATTIADSFHHIGLKIRRVAADEECKKQNAKEL
jgi:hypothetical protein